MTPEQTLDWLAQQHFDQCCEERPIQDWIRKMKSQLPEQPKQNTVEAVKAVLKGIDQTEIESPDGWWETSAGAEFGAKKLKYVVGLLAQPEQEPVAIHQFRSPHCSDWYDGIPDHHDGRGPYEVRTLYTTPPQRTWVGLTHGDIDQGLLRSDYALKTAEAWRAGVVFAMTKLKEKNT